MGHETTINDERSALVSAPHDNNKPRRWLPWSSTAGSSSTRTATNGDEADKHDNATQQGEEESVTTTATTAAGELWSEIKALLHIAVPTTIIQMGFVVPPFLTASTVGRNFGSTALGGFQLAYLTLNLFTLSLCSGLFSAADTLSPQAYGVGNYREVGHIAVRGFVTSMMIVVALCVPLAFCLEDVLRAFGEDAEAAFYAAGWYRIYVGALPFYGLYMATWKFLSAQHVMMPLVVASVITIGLVLPVSMYYLVDAFGFYGSAMSFALYQISQPVVLLGIVWWKRPHKEACWPGLRATWNEVFRWEPFQQFVYLGIGGILASSEWIYWETISLLIGTLGIVPLSVHTVPSQALTIAFMISFGIGVSLSIRLGHVLPHSVRRAKFVVWGTTVVSCIGFALASWALYRYRTAVYRIFTTDPAIIAGCDEIWFKVCLYFFLVSTFALMTGIANGLGMQWRLGVITLVFLWLLGVPVLAYYGIHTYQSLDVVWACIDPPYVFIDLALLFSFLSADWDDISMAICKREGVDLMEVDHVGPFGITYGSVEEERPLFVEAAREHDA